MWPFRKCIPLKDSGIFEGFTDWHSHILPGVDDGARTVEEALEILRLYEELGVKAVWLTPHIMEDIPNETVILQEKFQELKRSYNGTLELALAAEYMMDNLFEERLEKDDLLPLEEGKRYLLVETSYFNPPMELLSVLQRIQKKGYYPLLAHSERYEYMQKRDYQALKDEHVSFQLNLPSLAGMYGKHVQEKAEALLKAGMYDRTGCDIHAIGCYKTLVASAVKSEVIGTLQKQSDQ